MKDQERIKRLKEYVKGLKEGKNGSELYQLHKKDIEEVSPEEAFSIFFDLLQEGEKAEDILKYLGKVINVFSHGFEKIDINMPIDDRFLSDLLAENSALDLHMKAIRAILIDKSLDFNQKKKALLALIKELKKFDAHYQKKENILFPMLEKKSSDFEGLSIMWALHDKVRSGLKDFEKMLISDQYCQKDLNIAIGDLFFDILGLKHKEEKILFPAAIGILEEKDFTDMYKQSMEYDFPFIGKEKESFENETIDHVEGMIKTGTGDLTFEEAIMIFNNLPVDMTFVDENNKVRFFSRPKDRLFPRSTAVIGRDVKNCHPPQSVHIVEEILESFRAGKEDSATFWIDVKGKKVLIQYFALRDKKGLYKGVLEVSQDITQIQKLEGQRRVLDWDK